VPIKTALAKIWHRPNSESGIFLTTYPDPESSWVGGVAYRGSLEDYLQSFKSWIQFRWSETYKQVEVKSKRERKNIHTYMHTDRQTDRQTNKQKEWKTERQTCSQTEADRQDETHRETNRPIGSERVSERHSQTVCL